MSAPKRARDDEFAGAAAGGAGGAPPPPPPPARRRPATLSTVAAEAYERRLKLTDVIGFVALNGYARETDACAGLCRETWRCIPAGLSAADANRVRRDHPLWQAIINLKHGKWKATRLIWAAVNDMLSRVRELCEWRAGIEEADKDGRTPLYYASYHGRLNVVRELLARGANIEAAMNKGATSLYIASKCGHLDVVRELLARGANANAAFNTGATPLVMASWKGHVDVVRALLAAGADKHHVANNGGTATSVAGIAGDDVEPAAKAAILALLAAAP
jgi:hypothetical protein